MAHVNASALLWHVLYAYLHVSIHNMCVPIHIIAMHVLYAGEVKRLKSMLSGSPDLSRELAKAHQYSLQLERQLKQHLGKCHMHSGHRVLSTIHITLYHM